MSIDNNNHNTDFQKESNNQTSILNLKENEIEKELDNFISKDNYKYKVGNWLKDIIPISSPRSFIEKYYNENNPFALDEWMSHWGIDTHKYFSSLWIKTNDNDTHENSNNEEKNWDYMDMRKKQNSDWAHEIIYKGVTLAKSNEYEKAIKVYNHAIDIDPNCVDAYVAKGAAYANQEHYNLAIRNFEKALQIDPKCVNAKKYLKATQNRKAEEDRIKEKERKKQEEEERIKRENQSKDDIILDNSKLITSPLFMDMITVSPSRSDMKKSKKKRRKSHRRSRSRSRKKHKRHHSSKNKSHRHSTSSRKKHHSRRHSSKYSYSSDSSISTSYSSSDDYSTDSSFSDSYSDSDHKKEKRLSHYYNDNDDNSDNLYSDNLRQKRQGHHHHKSHIKRRRKEDDEKEREKEN
ncbi:hypothetical protein BCR32DRAFT_292779 [Anaeromyces robustus]|uniref:Uncharacterized protein n=1 Tax=Anaeromyces robustus TaxID=1754192 RepID=A0A1Y1X954_9FUNG|nr:hypothetical protein BCR32DRAFT_292779 [Anaeromyces robustus]|eukprot:ORX82280.1 hypothetical protein BCR32DRAFT_292779 [Anaeromyces robustus]